MSPTRLCLFATLCFAAVARADEEPQTEPPVADTPVAPQKATLEPVEVAASAPRTPFRFSSVGVYGSLGIGSGLSGDFLVGELGLQIFGLRDFDRKWLLYWDAALAARAGGLGNEHPYFFFGGSGHSIGEVGRRLFSDNTVSPYLSGRAQGHFSVMAQPGSALSELNTINNSQGFGGVIVDGSLRLSAGASYLRGKHSLVVTIFLQEQLRAPEGIAAGIALTEGGLALRYDLENSFSLYIEGIYGVAPSHFQPGLNTHDTTSHIQASGFLRKTFSNAIWVALSLSYGRDTDNLTYDGGGSFNSANPPDFAVTAMVGIPIGVKL